MRFTHLHCYKAKHCSFIRRHICDKKCLIFVVDKKCLIIVVVSDVTMDDDDEDDDMFMSTSRSGAGPSNGRLQPLLPGKLLRPLIGPILSKLCINDSQKLKNILSTSSLISPSFQGDPTIFHRGIFLKQTPHIKN